MDISNPTDWAAPHQYSRPLSNAPFILGTFTAQLIAIDISTTNIRDTWYTGGWLSQIININLGTENLFKAYSQRVKLGGSIIVFPNNYSSYQLEFSFPEWFQDGELILWEFKG